MPLALSGGGRCRTPGLVADRVVAILSNATCNGDLRREPHPPAWSIAMRRGSSPRDIRRRIRSRSCRKRPVNCAELRDREQPGRHGRALFEGAGLPPRCDKHIDLVYYRDKSVREVAAIVGIPNNTVKTRMFLARKRLAALLAAEGLGPRAA